MRDDGYTDVLAEALPVLEATATPATVFVCTDTLEDGSVFWWDRLAALVYRAPMTRSGRTIQVAGAPIRLRLWHRRSRFETIAALHRALRKMPPAAIDAHLDELEQLVGDGSATVPGSDRAYRIGPRLDVDALRTLASNSLITIGAHTRTHPWLTSLSADEQRAEIEAGRDGLESVLGTAVTTFAYPFGQADSYSDTTTSLVADAGFHAAWTTERGTIGATADRRRLPRCSVGSRSPDTLASELREQLRVTGVSNTEARPPLRVLVVYEEYGRYGTPMLARTLVGSLADHVEVVVVGPDEDTAAWIAADRPGTRTMVTQPVAGWRSFGAMRAFRRVITRVRPDVVHLCLPTPRTGTRYLAVVARSVRGVRCVGVQNSYDNSPRRGTRFATHLALTQLDAHVAGGMRVADIIEANYRLRPGSIRVIPCAIAPRAVTEVKSFGSRPVVGVVARLSAEKGVDVTVRAMAAMPETTLVVVGDGRDRVALEQLARDLGRAEHTYFVGFQDQPQDYVAGMDMLVQASRREAMGLASLEAMAAGIPVVATDVGSTGEAVDDGVTGYLVAPDDVDALRDAIARLLADPQLRARMGDAARAGFEAKFAAAYQARAYESLYDELAPPATRARRPPLTT